MSTLASEDPALPNSAPVQPRLIVPTWEPEIPPIGSPELYIPQKLKRDPQSDPLRQSFEIPKRYQGTLIHQGDEVSGDKAIALTFDDGPWPDTLKILEILRQQEVKATFFVLGQNLLEYPEIAQQVVQEGHAIGNHTWSHPYHALSSAMAAAEIDNTSAKLEQLTGAKTRLFRPPGGILNNGAVEYAKARNYVVVMWSIDTKDYQQPGVTTLVNRVVGEAHPGAIVLMHDGGGSRRRTVEALPVIIETLRTQGYRFVTLPELLKLSNLNE
ncbi:MAG: polysaccharide deacetylase family protein [Microcoleaceae cyanobacterium]